MVSLTFVGTATTVLRLGGVTVLTDPNFLRQGQRAYLGKGMWSRRLTDPAMQPDDLPHLDAVVLSHLHGDHWDRVAERSLDRSLPILTTPQAARKLARKGFSSALGLAAGNADTIVVGSDTVTVTAVPGQHGRGVMDTMLPDVMGSLYELERPGRDPFRLYVTGDTLLTPTVRQALVGLPPLDAVVVHTGGTRVAGMLVTLDDREGCDLLELLEFRTAVPVHYDDYPVFKTPLSAVVEQAGRRGLAERLRTVQRGDTIDLDAVS
jgi:L-ascorbate metabolism protein UlaG (beta-lactamase superfamily)